MLDDQPVRSCCMFAVQADEMSVTTVEGLAPERGQLSKIQDAFCEKHALQCGYCTPGMLIACQSLINRHPHPTEAQVREAISSNLCRCTGYQQIVDAVMHATSPQGQTHG
jgi:carbon-monoxide dehydrogenase small subunit